MIFFHKCFVLTGQIILFYVGFVFCFICMSLILLFTFLVFEWVTDFILNFSIEKFYYEIVYILFDTNNNFYRGIILIPLILFFMRPLLFILSEEDTMDKKFAIYNPFTDWGHLIYEKT